MVSKHVTINVCVEELWKENKALKKDLQSKTKENESKDAKMKELSKVIDNLGNTIENSKKEIDTKEAQLKTSNLKIQELLQEKTNLESSVNYFRKETESLLKEKGNLENTKNALLETVKQYETRESEAKHVVFEVLEQQHQELKRQIEKTYACFEKETPRTCEEQRVTSDEIKPNQYFYHSYPSYKRKFDQANERKEENQENLTKKSSVELASANDRKCDKHVPKFLIQPSYNGHLTAKEDRWYNRSRGNYLSRRDRRYPDWSKSGS